MQLFIINNDTRIITDSVKALTFCDGNLLVRLSSLLVRLYFTKTFYFLTSGVLKISERNERFAQESNVVGRKIHERWSFSHARTRTSNENNSFAGCIIMKYDSLRV